MPQSQKLSMGHHDCRQLTAKGWLEAIALLGLGSGQAIGQPFVQATVSLGLD